MRLAQFIKDNREEIDRCVWNFTTHRYNQPQKPSNDAERRDWIMNDEGLYGWARAEGCKI